MRDNARRGAMRFTVGYVLLSLAFAAATLLLLAAALFGIARLPEKAGGAADADSGAVDEMRLCFVIDAGHGGEDGGAVGVDGLLEKTVNLKIAQMLYDQLTLAGIPAIMTRTDDRMLYDPASDYRGHKKMLDLRARLDAVKQTPGAVLVSIHLNSFPQQQYSGLQVYYSLNHPDSAVLAELVQTAARQFLQPENDRKTKAAGSNIYLLNRSERPAVLIECGFLSNPGECAKLHEESYLGELSTMIFTAVCDYLGQATAGA